MAGVTDEIELEEALGIAWFQVAMGRVPPLAAWRTEQAQAGR